MSSIADGILGVKVSSTELKLMCFKDWHFASFWKELLTVCAECNNLFSHEVYMEAQRTKEDSHVCQGLLRCWKTMGVPDYLQLDNALNFRGSNRYPRSMGMVIRLCLSYGVHPIFIPIGTA